MPFTDTIFFEIALLAVGITGVWIGADSAVEGTSLISEKLGISRTVAGLTVIAVGTSLPELCICLIAAFRGSADIAAGNIIGSNISNIGLITGISAAIFPIRVRQSLVREAALAAVFLGVLIFLCSDGELGRAEGLGVTVFLVPLIVRFYMRQSAKTGGSPQMSFHKSGANAAGLRPVLLVIAAGLCALGLGSGIVVEGAAALAERAGVSELVIGASVVAVGTSLPELAASLAAALKREHAIAIGNIAGSNLFNIVILALTSSILPLKIAPEAPNFQLPFAVALSALFIVLMKKGRTIGRSWGTVLLILYGIFVYKIF